MPMPRRQWPQPRERFAREYRRAHEEWDREPVDRYGRAGFGRPTGFRGSYAERPQYHQPVARVHPGQPEGSGWPYPLYEVPDEAEERHLRALEDRELARAVDFALYDVLGRDADRLAVYADDAVVTLEGTVSHPRDAREALDAAWETPGVRHVRSALRVRRW